MAHEEVVREVPTELRQAIFHQYGILKFSTLRTMRLTS